MRLVLLLRLGRNFLIFHQSKPNSYSYGFHLLIFFHNSLKNFFGVAKINMYSENPPQIPQILFCLLLWSGFDLSEIFLLHKLLVSLLNIHVLNIHIKCLYLQWAAILSFLPSSPSSSWSTLFMSFMCNECVVFWSCCEVCKNISSLLENSEGPIQHLYLTKCPVFGSWTLVKIQGSPWPVPILKQMLGWVITEYSFFWTIRSVSRRFYLLWSCLR